MHGGWTSIVVAGLVFIAGYLMGWMQGVGLRATVRAQRRLKGWRIRNRMRLERYQATGAIQ